MIAYWQYAFDATQRSVLFLDVLRERGNQFFAHEGEGAPPVLVFEYEVLIDGRDLERPCNYVLYRILPETPDQIDGCKRPYVIVDPRAGHGPGIGGSKEDSQIGVALRAGHPVYFVSFRPVPEPGQTLEDIGAAEAIFLEAVIRRHPDAPKPCVIGNCQAGWAVAMLASMAPDLTGPIVLNGAPLSYWAGAKGKNPMRYTGGLWGGAWITSHMCTVGNNRFDGAYLVQNFENLNPANTLWSKQYNLYSKIDTEPSRYLSFEKWWTGFFQLTADEMEFIVNNLFVGNKLGTNQVQLSDGRTVSLKNIKAPIIVFCSDGDNITPPQQALNWILDVYQSDDEIIRDDQVIVYTLHKDIGHLGIFVSGSVAKKEHSAIVGTLEFVDRLPPGLYEMLIESSSETVYDDPRVLSDYQIRFVERSLDDLQRLDDTREEERYFDTLAQVSDLTTSWYKTFVQPWISPWVSEQTAALNRELNAARLQHYYFSDRNPFMWPVRMLAEATRANRRPIATDNPYLQIEREVSNGIETWLNAYRDLRDTNLEIWFKSVYGPLGLGMFFPPQTNERTMPVASEAEQAFAAKAERLRANLTTGGFQTAAARMIVLISRSDHDVEPRTLLNIDALADHSRFAGLSVPEVRAIVKDQFLTVLLERDKSIATLPELLPASDERGEALSLAVQVVLAGDKPNSAEKTVIDELGATLQLTADHPALSANAAGNGLLSAELSQLRADNERLRAELARLQNQSMAVGEDGS
jgi:poly(3-hydroxyalkanoate) synthetase